jgi:hypothetical protein
VPRKDASKPGREKKLSVAESDTTPSAEGGEASHAPESSPEEEHRKNGGWQEIEAMREKAALRASLADVWDEDFDLDDEILAELDHKAEFFTPQDDSKDEVFDDVDESDEFFDEEDE